MPTIGLDLGGTKLLAGVIDDDGSVLRCERRIIAGLSLEALVATVREAVDELGIDAPIGAGVPALMDLRTGRAVRCVHLPLDGVCIPEVLGADVVDNDATCAVMAEWELGAARGCDHVALLTLGTGIGGGLVLGGRVYRGAVGAGAELGHIPVDMDGPACFGGCPGRGCLESLCSGSALARDGSTLFGRPVTGEEVTRLALAGDPEAMALMETFGGRLGVGLAGIAMALNPEVIVLGGGVMATGELVLEPARAEMRARALPPARDARVVAAGLGEEAGMIGAGLLAR